jgi:hypothetical protein
MWYDPHMSVLRGLQFYDGESKLLAETSCSVAGYKSKETVLTEDERILGVRARR